MSKLDTIETRVGTTDATPVQVEPSTHPKKKNTLTELPEDKENLFNGCAHMHILKNVIVAFDRNKSQTISMYIPV
jgi:hypothetical protein